MGIVHYFWQTYLDKRQRSELEVLNQESMIEENRPEKNTPIWYSIFPVLPLFLVIFFWVFFRKAKVGLVEITLFSLVPAVVSELVRNKNAKETMKDLRLFFNGMGDGFFKGSRINRCCRHNGCWPSRTRTHRCNFSLCV